MHFSEYIYKKLPYWPQHAIFNIYALKLHYQRYGRPFKNALAELGETEFFDEDEIKNYQFKLLRDLVDHAYTTVPFYRELYDTHGVGPDDIRSIEDLNKLPLIGKEDVKNAGDRLISTNYKKRNLIHGHTSGTTGSPLSFFWDRRTCIYNNAVDWRQKQWAGIKYGDPIALFLGRAVVPPERKPPPFWQLDRVHNMLWVSSFHLSTQYLPNILKQLKKFRPAAIEGYPSTIYILARYLKSIGETFPVRAVFTSSETLFPVQKSLIEERFEAETFDFYGMAERVAFATQCETSHRYHLNFEYAINEIVTSQGDAVSEGGFGYLVGTSLLNYAMPFIRYKTTDTTSIETGKCDCGRSMPRLSGVTTKDEDIVVTLDGRLVSSSVLTHPFKPLDSVMESQIIQDQIDLLVVKIVRGSSFTERDSEHLISALKERVGSDMRIDIQFVDSIARTKSGKYRWVISRVPLPI